MLKIPIDILISYPFPEIELKYEYDSEPQLGNSISLPDSILTEIFLLDFRIFSESTLDPVSIHHEIESPIFYDQHLELDEYHTFESFTNWQVLIFMKLNSMRNVT